MIKFLRRIKLKNKNITIFANNCLAGFIYQRYGLKYLSPTIGINFEPLQFVKFCQNYKYYISLEMQETKEFNQAWFSSIGGGKIDFPVGKLGDINVYFQHSKSFQEAKNDWNKRKLRINPDNVYMILYDVNPSIEAFKEFEKINFKNKLYLYHKGEHIDSNLAFFIKGFNEKLARGWWSKMNKNNPFSKKYFEQFDYTKWFNAN